MLLSITDHPAGTLTFVIGIFLTYIGLGMMITDQWSALRNQSKTDELYERIRAVDEQLMKEQIIVDSSKTAKSILLMIVLTVGCELIILISTYITLVDYKDWKSILWLFSCFPTLYNSLDKIWFVSTLSALKHRFFVINTALEDMVESHERLNRWTENGGDGQVFKRPSVANVSIDPSLEYLYKELTHMEAVKAYNMARNKISPSKYEIYI